jgi:UBX domain-containing protein 1
MAVQGPPPDRRGDAFDDLVQRAHASSGVAAAGADGPDVSANKRKITLYKNGFIIDDNGILRDTNLPENAEVIRELEAGRVPAELSLVDGKPVHGMDVALEDRRGEDFVPPPPPAYKAFSGGNTLGAAAAVSDASNGAADAPCVFTPEALSGVDATVDAAKASTTVQVKTPAGKKIRIKVNEEFTVLQLAAFVAR